MSNVSVETLEKLREDMVGRRYKHFKGRNYIVKDIAVHTETDEIMVIYKCFTDPLVTWCRPLSMFTSDVDRIKYPNVKQKKRFEPLSEQEVQNV
jgi:hypothetical protein